MPFSTGTRKRLFEPVSPGNEYPELKQSEKKRNAEFGDKIECNGKLNPWIDYLALTHHLMELDKSVTQRKLNMTNTEGIKLTLFDETIMRREERKEPPKSSKKDKHTVCCNFCSDVIPSGMMTNQQCFSCKKIGCEDCLEYGCDYCKWHEGDYSLVCDDCGGGLNEEKCGQRTCDRCADRHYKHCRCLWQRTILD